MPAPAAKTGRADGAGGEIGEQRRLGEAAAIDGAEQQHRAALHRHRHRPEGDGDMGGGRQEADAEENQHRLHRQRVQSGAGVRRWMVFT